MRHVTSKSFFPMCIWKWINRYTTNKSETCHEKMRNVTSQSFFLCVSEQNKVDIPQINQRHGTRKWGMAQVNDFLCLCIWKWINRYTTNKLKTCHEKMRHGTSKWFTRDLPYFYEPHKDSWDWQDWGLTLEALPPRGGGSAECLIYWWHALFLCMIQTLSCVWLDLFIKCVTKTRSCVWHDWFICVTWLIHMCDMTHLCVTWLIYTRGMTHSYAWHDSFTRVTWRIHRTL